MSPEPRPISWSPITVGSHGSVFHSSMLPAGLVSTWPDSISVGPGVVPRTCAITFGRAGSQPAIEQSSMPSAARRSRITRLTGTSSPGGLTDGVRINSHVKSKISSARAAMKAATCRWAAVSRRWSIPPNTPSPAPVLQMGRDPVDPCFDRRFARRQRQADHPLASRARTRCPGRSTLAARGADRARSRPRRHCRGRSRRATCRWCPAARRPAVRPLRRS